MSASIVERVLDRLHLPRRVPSHAPLARALADHARSRRSRTLRVERSGGVRYRLDTDGFFELGGEQAPIDDAIVTLCVGRVLDVGAGAGRHALALQQRGLEVRAVDVSPICVDLMRARGVHDARVADVWSLAGADTSAAQRDAGGDAFDTILFGMQSIGIVGTVDGLEAMLTALARSPGLLAPGGQILLDSSAPVGPGFTRRIEFAAPAGPDANEAVAGESVVRFAYRGWRGDPFEWLYVGSDALRRVAADCGFDAEIRVRIEGSPEYLARLTRIAG